MYMFFRGYAVHDASNPPRVYKMCTRSVYDLQPSAPRSMSSSYWITINSLFHTNSHNLHSFQNESTYDSCFEWENGEPHVFCLLRELFIRSRHVSLLPSRNFANVQLCSPRFSPTLKSRIGSCEVYKLLLLDQHGGSLLFLSSTKV
jgi:hypothetical protein